MTLKDRFLSYVAFDTQSSEDSDTFPSTNKQLVLLNHLKEEMLAMGLTEVAMDEYGYVMGTIPATSGFESAPVIGFISHVDTSPDMSGKDINPQIIEDYDGHSDIPLKGSEFVLSPREFPELALFRGHTLITTDGTTLLGADDKAGVAEIMAMAAQLLSHPELKHGKIRIAFTPDEEIGRGVDFFDVERFGAVYAYTMDGSMEGELEYENFNAAAAKIVIQGRNVHPGTAKNKMISAIEVGMALHTMLPAAQRPEYTENYEGFYLLTNFVGTIEQAEMSYIIRDHDRDEFEEKKAFLESVVALVNQRYGKETVKLALKDQYYNMRQMVEPHQEVIEKAKTAMRNVGVEPVVKPIRGGTDGSRLSYMGLPCPNLFTGGMNFHGRYEYCSLTTMQRALETMIELVQLWARS